MVQNDPRAKENIFRIQKLIGPEIFFGPKIFGPKIFSDPNFLDQNFFEPQIFLIRNFWIFFTEVGDGEASSCGFTSIYINIYIFFFLTCGVGIGHFY